MTRLWFQRSRRIRRCSGQTLIVALTALILITAIMGAITVSTLMEARLASRHKDYVQAFYAARAGLEAGTYLLLEDDPDSDALSDAWAASPLYDHMSVGEAQYHVFYQAAENGDRQTGIVDEERKLNINTAEPGSLQALHPALTSDIVSAIVAQRQIRPFARLSEIELIPGVAEGFLDDPREGAPAGLQSMLTVYGDGRVNVNTAPLPVLRALGGLTETQAAKLIEMRAGIGGDADANVFRSVNEVRDILDMPDADFNALRSKLGVSSSHFRIQSRAVLQKNENIQRELRQFVRRDSGGITVLQFEQIN